MLPARYRGGDVNIRVRAIDGVVVEAGFAERKPSGLCRANGLHGHDRTVIAHRRTRVLLGAGLSCGLVLAAVAQRTPEDHGQAL